MKQNLSQLVRDTVVFFRLIPKGYRLGMLFVLVLVTGLITTILMVSSSHMPPPLETVKSSDLPIIEAEKKTPDTVQELFDPTTEQTNEQKRKDAVLANVDTILLNAYTLSRCRKLTSEEYSDTYQMLINFVMAHQLANDAAAADAVVRERASATSGSYELIYGRLKCGDIDTNNLAYALQVWRQNMRLAPLRNQQPTLNAIEAPTPVSP